MILKKLLIPTLALCLFAACSKNNQDTPAQADNNTAQAPAATDPSHPQNTAKTDDPAKDDASPKADPDMNAPVKNPLSIRSPENR